MYLRFQNNFIFILKINCSFIWFVLHSHHSPLLTKWLPRLRFRAPNSNHDGRVLVLGWVPLQGFPHVVYLLVPAWIRDSGGNCWDVLFGWFGWCILVVVPGHRGGLQPTASQKKRPDKENDALRRVQYPMQGLSNTDHPFSSPIIR